MNHAAIGSSLPLSAHGLRQGDMLAQSQCQWLQGDWEALCQLSPAIIEDQPHRGQLALLAAAAHHQLGAEDETHRWSRLALDWGCDKADIARTLISGVHNTLGRCAALLGKIPRMEAHFRGALDCPAVPQGPLASHHRTIHQLAKLGLLKDAASLMDQQIARLQQQLPPDSGLEPHVTILKSELSLLQHELSLAQRRGQLQPVASTVREDPPTSIGEAEERWLEQLRKKATSQIGQELWVLERTKYMRGGYFVEFGATNGILLSNTFLLEKEFGWRGLCAEPNPGFFKDLQKNRRCTVANSCIGATSGEQVEFIFAEEYGGMARDADIDNHKGKRDAYRAAGDTAVLTTVSLHDFLTAHKAPRTIDYVSIDTEGSEFSILETFPFELWDIRLLTIEHNFTEQRPKIRSLLEARGYRCQEAHLDDWFYKCDPSSIE